MSNHSPPSNETANPVPMSHATSNAYDYTVPFDNSHPHGLDMSETNNDSIFFAPPAIPTVPTVLMNHEQFGDPLSIPESTFAPDPAILNPSTPLQARRGRDGFWKLTSDRPSTPNIAMKEEPFIVPTTSLQSVDDVVMPNGDEAVHTTTTSAASGGSGISLVLRLPAGGINGGNESRQSSPGTSQSVSSKKRKAAASTSTRSFRPRHSSPSALSNTNGHHSDHPDASPAPSSRNPATGSPANARTAPGALSIFSAPDASETIPDALTSIISKTAILSSRLRARDRDGDAMIRDAAEGLESSRTLRPSRARDAGVRTGVSASGKGVKVGGAPRTATLSSNSASKKKGKGKNAENDVPNQDFCSSCRGIGRFLCCDGCPRSFHFMCLEPPFRIDELPKEERWFCKKCKTEQASAPPATPVKDLKPIPMVFTQLSQKIDQDNPLQFRLPQEIRQFFQGVATGPKGDYVDAEEARTKYDRKGFQEDRDPTRLRDGKSRPIVCYVCGGSSIPAHALTTEPEAAWRQIVSCDYCPLHWHLDCLDPPLASMPNSGRRWMCPNHIEHVMPRRRAVRNNLETVDVEERGQRNNGNITIVADEPPPAVQYEDMVINNRKYRVPERIIRLDFWEKLRLGKGRVIPPARNGDLSFETEKRASGIGSDLTPLESDVQPTHEELEAASLILGLLHPAATKQQPPVDALQIPTNVGSIPDAGDGTTRKIMLRVPKADSEGKDILMDGFH